jgi:integrase/recombinase XerD
MLPSQNNEVGVSFAGQISDNTRRAYTSDLCSFFGVDSMDRLNAEDLGRITVEQVIAYRNSLLARYKPATVARKMSSLRSLFDFLCSTGLLRKNPATSKLARSPKVSQDSNTAGLTQEEAELLLRQPDRSTQLGKRDYAILLLMITAGLRRSEVVSVKKSNIFQVGSHYVMLVTGKGGKVEQIKLKPGTYTAIFEYGNTHNRDEMFLNRYGKPMSAQSVWDLVEKYCHKAGIEKNTTPHSLRHTFVTLAIDNGASLVKVQAAARHADPKTTIRYFRNKHNLDDNAIDYIPING